MMAPHLNCSIMFVGSVEFHANFGDVMMLFAEDDYKMYKFLYAHVEQLFCPLDLLFCHILVSIANLVWLRSPKASLNMDFSCNCMVQNVFIVLLI